MKKIYNIIKFFFGLTILILMFSFSFKEINNSHCFVSDIKIQISEHGFVTKDLIINYLKQDSIYPAGILFNYVSFKKIEESLNHHNHIKEAEVYSDMFGNLTIDVIQRNPIVRLHSNNNSFYLDDQGEVMNTSSIYTSRLLVISGDINSIDMKDLFFISEYIYNNDFLRKQIVQIDVSDSQLFMVPRFGDIRIIEFGKIVDIEEKFNKLMTYYINKNNYDKEYKIINLEYQNQIVCK